VLIFVVAIVLILFLRNLHQESENGYETCWSGKSQDHLECYVAYSNDKNSEQMKNYYVKTDMLPRILKVIIRTVNIHLILLLGGITNYYWNRNWSG
jgi:hypothetical protein